MFTVVYGVLLAPLPYGRPGELVSVGLESRTSGVRVLQNPAAAYFNYKRFAQRVENVGFHRTGNGNIQGGSSQETERVTATWITASTIPTLDVTPLIGRSFTEEEDAGSGPQAVMLSEGVWRTRFNADPGVLGKILTVNSVPRRIVGVMPASFRFPTADTRVWLPAKIDRNASNVGDFSYRVVARLKPGITPREAQTELTAIFPRIAELHPRLESGTSTSEWLDDVKPTPVVTPLRDAMTTGIARTLWMLAASAGLVLLVACANVANLMMIRADARQLELAVRAALGASRLRILTHFAGESMLLAIVSGALALPAVAAAIRALVALGPADIPRLAELHVGMATLGFTIVISVAAAAVCTVVPAFHAHRSTLGINLRDGGRSDTAGKARHRLRGMIASLQVAVALVVMIGSVLLLRTFQRLSEEHPGFDAANVQTFWVQLPFARYGGPDSTAVRFFARLTESVARLPGVREVGLTSRLPLGSGETLPRSFRVSSDAREVSLPSYVIGDGYLAAMRIPLIAGRNFQATGVQRGGEVIVSRRAAVALWRDSTGAAAVGRQIAMAPSGPTYTVIGVAGDVHYQDLAVAPVPALYVPQADRIDSLEPSARRTLALVVKTSVPPASIVTPVRRIVHDLDPAVPTFNVEPMTDVIRASTARLSLTLTLMSAGALITLLLSAIGLYGVMAYTVALRTREFGIRAALGAEPRAMAGAVAAQGLKLIGAGILAGLALFGIVGPFLRAFLYGVSFTDPLTLAVTSLGLTIVAALATWIPARRAAQVDPAEAMRSG